VSLLSCVFCFIAHGLMESILLVVLLNPDLLVHPNLQDTANFRILFVVSFLGWVDLKCASQLCLYTVYQYTFLHDGGVILIYYSWAFALSTYAVKC